ncbi:MAG: aminopeptidase P N-terminal domain-containing protein [Cyclobacteriaceae bacterium]|nr:aminopeptidase P N-terminal domain-containing protein [Cyclobacteriaceae bacterium]
MKYLPTIPQLFTENRKKLVKELKTGAVAILFSNDIMPTNADGTMRFKQQTDLFYLTGIDQEESILLLAPDHPDERLREILFLRETNEDIAIWEGHKYTQEEAIAASGVQRVEWNSQFLKILQQIVFEAEFIYLNTNEHLRASTEVQTRDARFINWCKEKYPLHKYERLAPLMHRLRAIKAEVEIDLIQKAAEITGKAFHRVLSFVKPGVHEYEIEAEIIHEFLRNKATGFSFEPIIASGFNACVLHYISNKEICKDGDVLLLDFGADFANYAGDMTRSIPVNGRFTKRQKDVYNAVLRVQREAMKMLTPGNTITAYHKEVGKIMESELLGLGLITQTDIKNQNPAYPAYKKYFMHGTSHHLGLDVHDYGDVYRAFEPGMVFTVEPGIYIREESLGIRLENDVVIRNEGTEDLMANIPIEAEEIEELMNAAR